MASGTMQQMKLWALPRIPLGGYISNEDSESNIVFWPILLKGNGDVKPKRFA